jgi:GBP family porin
MIRKTTLAAVLLSIGGVAAAQSSLNLYGVIDLGLQWNRQYASATGTQESIWGVQSGYQNGSRWGLSGAEALGGGWQAIFTLEDGFDASTGTVAQGGVLFGRQAWAGVQGPWGSVVLGRIATPSSGTGSWDLFGAVDPFAAGFGINTIGSTFVAANSLREDNAALYVTPDWHGLKAAVGYSFNQSAAEVAPQDGNTRITNLALSYGGGPWRAVATYDVIAYPAAGTPNQSNAGKPDEKLLQLGVNYDFRIVTLYAAWAEQTGISAIRAGVSIAPPSGLAAYDNRAWMLGASVPIGRGLLMGSYQYADAKNYLVAGGSAFEPDYAVWGLAYTYPLSMRTNLYTGYGQVQARGTLDPTQTDQRQFALGLRHQF